jgi:hypothetical protein
LFNFVGKVSKTLFGTLDDDDAQFYHEHRTLGARYYHTNRVDETAADDSKVSLVHV